MTARANDPAAFIDRPTGVCDLSLWLPDASGRFPRVNGPISPRVRASLDPSADTDAPVGSLILAGDGTTQPYVMGPSSVTVTLGSLLGASTLAITDGSTWYTADTLQGVADGVVAAIGGTSQGVRTYSEGNVLTSNQTVYASLEALDLKWGDLASTANGEGASLVAIEDAGGKITAATVEGAVVENRTLLDLAKVQLWPMAVLGPWAIDGDGAQTNGAGMVGTTPTLTEAASGQAKVEDDAVFANLADSAGEAGYTGAYQLFPDTPVAETDYVYFGASVAFTELAFDLATVATFDAAGVLAWEYWNGAAWASLTIAYDGTSTSTADGTLSFGRDGAVAFVPPSDWAQSEVDGVTVFWVRVGIASGKAANLTQVPLMNSVQHYVVSPSGGFVCPTSGTVSKVRLSDNAATLHTAADVKFHLWNYTTGLGSGELTFAQDVRAQVFTGLSLAVNAADVLGVVVTQEDGTNEPTGVLLELTVTVA